MTTGAIFLDRDGTINVKPPPHHYVATRDAFQFLPGALDALAFLNKNSERRIVVVTNQACVGKRVAYRAEVDELHAWMVERIEEAGGRVDKVYVCPHMAWQDCGCRKPKAGMLLAAAHDLDLDLSRSVMIGDARSDMQAGWAAGVGECYLVMTGEPLPHAQEGDGEYAIYAGLLDVAHAIERKERS